MDISKIKSASIKTPEKPGDTVIVTANGQEFRALRQTGAICLALDYFGEPATEENIAEFIGIATRGLPAEAYRSDISPRRRVFEANQQAPVPDTTSPPAKPIKKRKAKVEKKPQTPTFVGKLYTDKERKAIYEVIKETPPIDWQFQLLNLQDPDRTHFTLTLKEFKELIELVPKRSKKKGVM